MNLHALAFLERLEAQGYPPVLVNIDDFKTICSSNGEKFIDTLNETVTDLGDMNQCRLPSGKFNKSPIRLNACHFSFDDIAFIQKVHLLRVDYLKVYHTHVLHDTFANKKAVSTASLGISMCKGARRCSGYGAHDIIQERVAGFGLLSHAVYLGDDAWFHLIDITEVCEAD